METKESNMPSSNLSTDETKKIADLFTLLIQIDKRQKGKIDDRHN